MYGGLRERGRRAASGTRGLRRTAMELRHENYLYKND